MLLRLIHDALLAESVAIVIVQMTPIRLQMANAKSFGSFHATGLVILTVDTAMQGGRRSYKFAGHETDRLDGCSEVSWHFSNSHDHRPKQFHSTDVAN
jgi:hypothetical protein